MESPNSVRPNDVLYVLQLLGDYVRAGQKPQRGHPVAVRLCKLITTDRVFKLYCDEARDRLETLRNRHSNPQVTRPRYHHAEAFQMVLPQYCRLHSVVHGLHMWERMQPETFSASSHEELRQLISLDNIVLTMLIDQGLTFEMAEEVLIFAGRELIDSEMTCFHDLPLESQLSPPSSANNGRMTDCFRR